MIVNVIQSLILSVVFIEYNKVESLNILGVFPYPGKSHFYVFEPYLQELARRGNNVTVISYFPQNKPIKNYHDISLAGKAIILENVMPFQEVSHFVNMLFALGLAYTAIDNCEKMLEDEDVQHLWKTKMKFDVVVVEQFNSDCSLGLAYKLDAPTVGITSHVLMPYHYNRFGIFYNPSHIPFLFLDGGTKPSLYQRVERTLFELYYKFLYKYIIQNIDHKTLSQYFEDIPPLEELARDIKILLLYNNFVLTGSNIFPSNIIEVGGYHVAKPKPLQGELRKFIEESEHGVIYISFGSMLRAASIPKDKLQAILQALAELPQRVVWKWEAKSLPGKPKNIFSSKWLPQNDLLAHPKVLAFYSHCGLLGTTESIFHGVPILGMPMFAEQSTNAAGVEENGFGVKIRFEDLTKDNLLEKFKTVLDPHFRANVKLRSRAWHDRPVSAMDSAVYWTEFAARYHNLTFRAPAADVPLYQYLCLDVFFIVFVIPITLFFVSVYSIYRLCMKNKSKMLIKSKSNKGPKND